MMKKNFKTTVLAMALLASVSGVFAADVVKAIKGNQQEYDWQKYDRLGNEEGSVIRAEENPFADECPGGTLIECAVGTPVGGGTPLIDYYEPL